MCGILGFFQADGLSGHVAALQAANDIASHRGPDGAGFALFRLSHNARWSAEGIDCLSHANIPADVRLVLGHRRLAIIDLSPSARQPMSIADGSLWITYNGEIYNYLELRAELEQSGHVFHSQSDTEVILHAYQEWGDDCVNRFNGMWAFAIADLKHQRIFCSRDRLGIKPFHYFFDGERFLFASEIKQLLCFPFIRKRINPGVVYDYLAFGAIDYNQETFFAGITKLLHGHNLVFDLREHTLKTLPYYRPNLQIDTHLDIDQAAQEFRRLLSDSVRLHLRSDVEVGSCLSGGLDSSAIVCLMNLHLRSQGKAQIQHTFSSHFEAEEANEMEYMQEVIRHTSVQAHFTYPQPQDLLNDLKKLVWHQEEPFGSTSIFAQWAVFKLIHTQRIKVVLDGQGADEMLAGYLPLATYFFKEYWHKKKFLRLIWEMWCYKTQQHQPWSALLPDRLRRVGNKFDRTNRPNPPISAKDVLQPDWVEAYGSQSAFLAQLDIQPFGPAERLNNHLYQMTFLNNLPALLKYEDRNSMAHSVEARVPFLDYRLIEFLFSLPSDFKIRDGYTKRVMRDGMAGILPEKIRWRTSKLGFATPERTWQRTALRPIIEQAIQNEHLRPFIIPELALAYWLQTEKYNLKDFTPWRWVNLSLWLQAFEVDFSA